MPPFLPVVLARTVSRKDNYSIWENITTNHGYVSSLKSIAPEINYLEYLQPSMRRPEYWSNLESSKTKTSAQEMESRNVVEI